MVQITNISLNVQKGLILAMFIRSVLIIDLKIVLATGLRHCKNIK